MVGCFSEPERNLATDHSFLAMSHGPTFFVDVASFPDPPWLGSLQHAVQEQA